MATIDTDLSLAKIARFLLKPLSDSHINQSTRHEYILWTSLAKSFGQISKKHTYARGISNEFEHKASVTLSKQIAASMNYYENISKSLSHIHAILPTDSLKYLDSIQKQLSDAYCIDTSKIRDAYNSLLASLVTDDDFDDSQDDLVETIEESALDAASQILKNAEAKEREYEFSDQEIDTAAVQIKEVLQAQDERSRTDAIQRHSTNKVFKVLLVLFLWVLLPLLVNYLPDASKQLWHQWQVTQISRPAVEYATHSTDKPHLGITRHETRVYARPDKRSSPLHTFREGEYIALMWARKPGWRCVAYEVDLETMKATKLGWIQDQDYDRTRLPARSLLFRLYEEP